MSAAPAPAAPAEGEAPKGGKKKLIIIGAAVAVLLAGGGGGYFYMAKKKAAEEAAAAEAEGGGEEADAHAKPAKKAPPAHDKKKDEHAGPPAFVPLEPFTVNLTDRDVDRFAQIGINLQVEDAHTAEEMKGYMPAIRNAILLILSHKSSEQLLSLEGKEKLAEEIRREAARAMGFEIEDPDEDEDGAHGESDAPKKKKKKKKKVESYNPIVHVHYATFIIQ